MAEVSRNLVAILLVLVIVVSAVGTWSLFTSKGNVEYSVEYPGLPADASGYVALEIDEAPPRAGVAIEITEVPSR